MKKLSLVLGSLFVFAACNESASEAPVSRKVEPAATIVTDKQNSLSPKYKIQYEEVSPHEAHYYNQRLLLPNLNMTGEQITEASQSAIEQANYRIRELQNSSAESNRFENTFGELDLIFYEFEKTYGPVYLLKEVTQDAEVRKAASEQAVALGQWSVEVFANQKLYQRLKSAAEALSGLTAEEQKYINETLRTFERAGMALSDAAREEVTTLKKRQAVLEEEFSANLSSASSVLKFTPEELEGVSPDFINANTNADGEVEVDVAVTYEYLSVSENAIREASRKRAKIARYSILQDENTPILQELIGVRDQVANKLGYKSWADYQVEVNMAKTPDAVVGRLEELKDAFEVKFQSELTEMKALKDADRLARPEVVETENFNVWDFRYYQNQLKKTKYNVDTSELANYFPMESVKQAVFKTFGDLFGLDYRRIESPYKWVDDLETYMVSDRETGAPLGIFYLDLYPRVNKYSHFAHFGLVPSRQMSDGLFNRPVSALICNFPKATANKPSLLNHSHVETFFHEFGHLMHSMLSQASLSRFAGTSVEQDFVEAPSQMFEAWASDPAVLSQFARHYETGEPLSPEVIRNIEKSIVGTIGFHYRRQLTFGLIDMRVHGKSANKDIVQATTDIFSDVFLPAPEGTNFSAYWGHVGSSNYAAGYYGYAWADVVSQDLLSAFEEAPNGLLDLEVGQRLRKEIYERGGSRSAEESVRAFLGRDYNIDAFAEKYELDVQQGASVPLPSDWWGLVPVPLME